LLFSIIDGVGSAGNASKWSAVPDRWSIAGDTFSISILVWGTSRADTGKKAGIKNVSVSTAFKLVQEFCMINESCLREDDKGEEDNNNLFVH
jgi:hypothetical protein